MGDAARIWFRFLRLEARIRLAVGHRLKEVGLSIAQCDVLTTLTEREGLSQQELAERLYVTKGNISGLIDRLAAAGLVERRSIANDRRSHALYLTDAGRAIARDGISVQEQYVANTLGRMDGKDLAEFERLIMLTRDFVRCEGGDGPGKAASVARVKKPLSKTLAKPVARRAPAAS